MRRFARSLTAGLLALGTLATMTAQADAELHCLSPSERTAFDVQALRSELMVLAVGCGDDHPYNAFIERYKPELMENEHAITSYFHQKYGRRGQQEHDRFVTELANAQASSGSHLGSEFCPRNTQIFHEAMALRSADELRPFAAGQALFPQSMDVCPVEVAQAPERKPARRAKPKHH
jgi:hypothetical protein